MGGKIVVLIFFVQKGQLMKKIIHLFQKQGEHIAEKAADINADINAGTPQL